MANVKTNLNFHQTFSPDANAISMLLSVAEERTAYSKEEISDITERSGNCFVSIFISFKTSFIRDF